MAQTIKLITSECAAHYGRLWLIARNLINSKQIKKHAVGFETVIFAQTFALWVDDTACEIGYCLDLIAPFRTIKWQQFGADPLVGEQLDFIADNLNDYVDYGNKHFPKDVVADFEAELEAWHYAIILRTQNDGEVKYLQSIKCKHCNSYSVIKNDKTYICAKVSCCRAWQTN